MVGGCKEKEKREQWQAATKLASKEPQGALHSGGTVGTVRRGLKYLLVALTDSKLQQSCGYMEGAE